MDDDINTAFLILCLFFPTFTCLVYCGMKGYMMRKEGGSESRRHDLSAARTIRLQLQELREQISRHQEQKIHDPLRLEQIKKALNFETLRPPSPEPLKAHQDEEQDTADGSTVPESCQCCEEKKDDNDSDDDANGVDVEQNAIPSSTSSQNVRFSSSSMTKGVTHNSNAFTSILAMLVQPWTEGDGDDDLEKNCCCICLESYQSGQVICSPKLQDCDHVFHETCAIQWFKNSDECPLCRSSIITTSLVGTKETLY